jgi:hypothetical protein
MAGVGAPLMVAWQACGRDEGGGRRRGAAGGAAWGEGTAGGGAWGRCRAACLLSALLPVSVKAAVRGSLLCVRGRKQEEGEEEKKRKKKKKRGKKKKKI